MGEEEKKVEKKYDEAESDIFAKLAYDSHDRLIEEEFQPFKV